MPRTNYQRWRESGETITVIRGEEDWIKAWRDVAASEVIVDALLGTGIRGGASGLLAQVIENINRFSQDAKAAWPAWIVAVDTPSGLPSDGEAAEGPVLRAHLTVTFTAPKIGQLISRRCRTLWLAWWCAKSARPAALVEEVGKGKLRWAGPEEFSELPLQRPADAHKGNVRARSVGSRVRWVKRERRCFVGRPRCAVEQDSSRWRRRSLLWKPFAAAQPEYMTEALPATASGTIASEAVRLGGFATLMHGMTVLGIGPGIGTHPETQEFVRSVVSPRGSANCAGCRWAERLCRPGRDAFQSQIPAPGGDPASGRDGAAMRNDDAASAGGSRPDRRGVCREMECGRATEGIPHRDRRAQWRHVS